MRPLEVESFVGGECPRHPRRGGVPPGPPSKPGVAARMSLASVEARREVVERVRWCTEHCKWSVAGSPGRVAVADSGCFGGRGGGVAFMSLRIMRCSSPLTWGWGDSHGLPVPDRRAPQGGRCAGGEKSVRRGRLLGKSESQHREGAPDNDPRLCACGNRGRSHTQAVGETIRHIASGSSDDYRGRYGDRAVRCDRAT